ncbi:MAG: nucleotidyltransferase domain-containing protein [Nanoarchaeota archaeon]
MNTLSRLLTEKNLLILTLLGEEELSVREAAERAHCSPGKVHQAAVLFKRHGLVKVKKVKNRSVLVVQRQNPLYRKVKALVNVSEMLHSEGYRRLREKALIGIYGSFAQGTDDKDSDVDLLIVTEKKELEIRDALRMLEKNVKRKISPLKLSKEKLSSLEQRDQEFYLRLRLTTLALNGEIFE